MGSHTPGPWEVLEEGAAWHDGHAVCVYDDANIRLDIAYTTRGWGDEEQEANARLIAAAPDLLLACRRMVDRLGTFGSLHESLTDEAAEAIQKATGGTE